MQQENLSIKIWIMVTAVLWKLLRYNRLSVRKLLFCTHRLNWLCINECSSICLISGRYDCCFVGGEFWYTRIAGQIYSENITYLDNQRPLIKCRAILARIRRIFHENVLNKITVSMVLFVARTKDNLDIRSIGMKWRKIGLREIADGKLIEICSYIYQARIN